MHAWYLDSNGATAAATVPANVTGGRCWLERATDRLMLVSVKEEAHHIFE